MRFLQKQFILFPLIFLFGGVVQLTLLYFHSGRFSANSTFDYLVHFVYAGSYWLMLTSASFYNTKWLDRFIPWLENPLKRTLYSLVNIAAFTFIVIVGVDFVLDVLLLGRTPGEAITSTSIGYWDALIVTLAVNVIIHGRSFLYSWRQTSVNVEKLRTEQVSTQYQSLKNQVNPHFLFNSLNALSSLVYDDQDKAVEFIRKLSRVYRYVLDQKDAELVKVEDELDFTENFIFLQQIRFGDNLNIQLEKETVEGLIPPLAIQLLVENAIKHNVVSEKYPLNILISVKRASIVVSNSIREKISKDSTGIGLKNLKERYKYLTDDGLTINNDGQTFEIILPILPKKT